jgi:hypothetical protein
MFFHKRIGGLFCRDCVDKYFKEYTLTTLLFGWWGVISVFATPVVLLINFCNLFRARSLESVAHRSKIGARASFALALPLLALAVYVVVYASGLWTLGQTQLAPRVFYGPAAHVTLAALVGFALNGFAGVRPLSALVGRQRRGHVVDDLVGVAREAVEGVDVGPSCGRQQPGRQEVRPTVRRVQRPAQPVGGTQPRVGDPGRGQLG